MSFICDRRRASVPQSQLTFVEYVVKPCFRWGRMAASLDFFADAMLA